MSQNKVMYDSNIKKQIWVISQLLVTEEYLARILASTERLSNLRRRKKAAIIYYARHI